MVLPVPEAFCSTYSGYQRHHRLGEPPCEGCRAAAARYRAGLRKSEGGGSGVSVHDDDGARPAPGDWADDGLCRNHPNGDLWFPERGASTVEAKAICRACPVQQECLEHAIRVGEKHGIWGGRSERERRRIRRGVSTRRGAA